MKLNQLRLLAAVAKAGSIKKAAHASHLSQPTLSKSIQDLEAQLGAPLLVRGATGATLTPYGAIVVKRMATIETEITHIREEVNWLKGELAGQVTIGVSPTAAAAPVAAAIARLAVERPAISVELLELRPGQIVEGLRNRSLDIGLLHYYGERRSLEFQRVTLKSFDTVLIMGGCHPPETTLDALAESSWTSSDPSSDADGYVPVLVRDYDIPAPRSLIRCSSMTLYANLARRDGAVSHWSESGLAYLEPQIRKGNMTALRLDRPLPRLHVVLACQDEILLTPAAAKLVRSLSDLETNGADWL